MILDSFLWLAAVGSGNSEICCYSIIVPGATPISSLHAEGKFLAQQSARTEISVRKLFQRRQYILLLQTSSLNINSMEMITFISLEDNIMPYLFLWLHKSFVDTTD